MDQNEIHEINEKDEYRLKPVISIFLIVTLVIIDQITKIFAAAYLPNTPEGVSVVNGVLSLYYVENTGISFSLLASKLVLIIVVTSIIIATLSYVLLATPKEKKYLPFSVTLAVIIAGAVGNLIDRIIRGYVVDFIKVDFINFPIFNFADICVCLGLFVLVILIIFKYKENDFRFIFKREK